MATSTPTLPELVTMAVQQGQMPRHLFKYRTISNLDNLLINGQLWFSKPNVTDFRKFEHTASQESLVVKSPPAPSRQPLVAIAKDM